MLEYLSLDNICSSKLTVSLELSSRKTVRFSEQIMSAEKYPSIFSRQMEAQLFMYLHHLRVCHGRTHKATSSQDLIPQLVEHCTGIAEVMGSNPVQG